MDFFYRLDGSLNDLPALCEMKNVHTKNDETFSDAAAIFHMITLRCLAEIAKDERHIAGQRIEDLLAEAFIMITRLSLISTDENKMREALTIKINKLKIDLGMV